MASDTSTTKQTHQHCLVRIFFINRLEITFHAKDNMSCMAPILCGGKGGMSSTETGQSKLSEKISF